MQDKAKQVQDEMVKTNDTQCLTFYSPHHQPNDILLLGPMNCLIDKVITAAMSELVNMTGRRSIVSLKDGSNKSKHVVAMSLP